MKQHDLMEFDCQRTYDNISLTGRANIWDEEIRAELDLWVDVLNRFISQQNRTQFRDIVWGTKGHVL